MHFQDKRLYGYNAITMATSPIFFFTTIHFLVQTYQAIKKIWLCFVLPWGGVTPISKPLLENGRSTIMSEHTTLHTVGEVCSNPTDGDVLRVCNPSSLSDRKTLNCS